MERKSYGLLGVIAVLFVLVLFTEIMHAGSIFNRTHSTVFATKNWACSVTQNHNQQALKELLPGFDRNVNVQCAPQS
ncbi:MAG: hypothetical protein K5Q00_01195 [Gammaproteobacteria bacterium]|nr:hypothetical protein [Gammaproteobacteria bacterium]